MTPDNRALLYMVAAHMGAVATAFLVAAQFLGWPDFVQGLFTGVLIVSIVMLMRRRLRDEYVESLWQAGTTFCFVVTIVWFLLAPYSEGFIDGLFSVNDQQDFPKSSAAVVAAAAFFIGFHIKWLRSRL